MIIKINTKTLLENWKTMEHKSDSDTNCNWCACYSYQKIGTGTGERVETIQTTTLLRSVRILRRVLEICCHLDSSGKPSANAGVKNSQMSKMIKVLIHIKELQLQITILNTDNLHNYDNCELCWPGGTQSEIKRMQEEG